MVKSVKLADIAKKMDVSVVTVSKALSDQKGVSEEMRARIKECAKELGYMPVHGKQKEPQKSYTVGVISAEKYFARFASFYWKMYQEVVNRASRSNSFTMLEVISYEQEEQGVLPKILEEQKVDGVIILGKMDQQYLKAVCRYQKKIPIIFLDFYNHEFRCDAVISSGFYGMFEMTQYLYELGHREIGYVGTLMATESITDRYFGYCKCMMEHHLPVNEEWIIKDRDLRYGIIGMEYTFELPEKLPTAFVCNNDVTAYALIKTLEKKGYHVPQDVSVVGYDNYIYPEFGESQITTYNVNMKEMCKLAFKKLVKQMEHQDPEQNIHVVPGKLIERDTADRPSR